MFSIGKKLFNLSSLCAFCVSMLKAMNNIIIWITGGKVWLSPCQMSVLSKTFIYTCFLGSVAFLTNGLGEFMTFQILKTN